MMAFTFNTTEREPSNGSRLRAGQWRWRRWLAAWVVWLLSTNMAICTPPIDPKNSSASALKVELRYIATEQASLYAGPSEDFYPTMHLQRGEAIEVYHRTGDGWLAVRPPQGSFSWLPAAQGLLLPGGRVVEVTEKSAVAWIGTNLGTAKQYRWQVKLNQGEQLAVLGEQTIRDEASGNKSLWYKIAPPSGEYRWIQEKATTADNPSGPSQSEDDASGASDGDQVDKSSNSNLVSSDTGSEVEQASGEETIGEETIGEKAIGSSVVRRGSRNNGPTSDSGKSQALEDPWESWHAVEFKNGAFSFPGIARMFGMQPATSNSVNAYDPFDPRNQTRRRQTPAIGSAEHQSVAAPRSQESRLAVSEDFNRADENEQDHSLLENESKGWRDPRELRLARQRASNLQNNRDVIANNLAAASSSELSTPRPTWSGDISDGQDKTVGSAVVPASVNVPDDTSTRQGEDASWYGIRQAPPASSIKAADAGVGAAGGVRPLAMTNADLAEVQLRLSEMVAGPEHTWNLVPLADRTRYLIEHGATAIERGEARLLLDRIDAFSQLAKRSQSLGMSLAASTSASPPTQLPVAPAINNSSPLNAAAARWASPLGVTPSSGSAGESSSASSVAPRFDATGWVVPVHGSNRDMPTHALTNDSGKIIVYLTPAPGINLARFQAQAVGVYGLRGYLPQLRANHIQVQRVVRLQ